jgi:hypothetical protein
MSGAPPLKKVRRGLMPKGLFIKLVIKYLDFAPRAQQQQPSSADNSEGSESSEGQ